MGVDWGLIARPLAELREHGGHVRVLAPPDDPLDAALARAARIVPHKDVALSLLDHGVNELPDQPQAELTARPLLRGEHRRALDFDAPRPHPVELASLQLDDLGLAELDAAYRARADPHADGAGGLRRLPPPAGMCIVNHGVARPEPAADGERDRAHPRPRSTSHRAVWDALPAAALAEIRPRRDWTAALVHPDDRPLAIVAGLTPRQPQRLAAITFAAADDTFARALR